MCNNYAVSVPPSPRQQESKEQKNHDFWAPEQIHSLLRFIRKGDLARLAEHPFAYSKTMSSYIQRAKISRTQHNIGAMISDFVTTLILRKLSELQCSVSAIADEGQHILSDIKSGALSSNKELKRWSLLAHHYIDRLSIGELSRCYAYSTRQIEYELKLARCELAKILLTQEKLSSDTGIQKDIYLGKEREGIRLSLSEKESLLNSMTTAYSAPCSAFLWGDWSVLVSKKAVIVPINKRVTVGLKPSARNSDCSIYYWSDREEKWLLDERHSTKIKSLISEGWLCLSSLHELITSNHQPIQVCVFSDVPFGCGIHERAAMFLCLAGCINNVFGLGDFHEHRVEQIAAILESFWYPQISWAPIVCSSRSPNSPKVIIFDRTEDDGIDFKSISSGDDKEIKRNRFLNDDAIKIDLVDFDVTKLAVLSHKVITTDLDEVHRLYSQSLSLLHSVGFEFLSKLLVDYILDLDYEKVGMMMNLHQDILSACGLPSSSFNAFLRTLRYEPRILGVKPSCCLTTHSALIALLDGSLLEVAQDLVDLAQPISPFLAPTPGLVRIF